MKKTEAAFLLSVERLAEQGRLYFWTFTFADTLDLVATRKRWNHLLTLIRAKWPDACGLRVFEMHEEHGLHVHLLTNKRIDVNECRKLAKQAGWGRIHVERIPRAKASYLAKYLSKERPPALRKWRLWAGFGKSWEWSKVSNLVADSLFSSIYRGLAKALQWEGNKGFKGRMALVEMMAEVTITEGWKPGFGPDGEPYSLDTLYLLVRLRGSRLDKELTGEALDHGL